MFSNSTSTSTHLSYFTITTCQPRLLSWGLPLQGNHMGKTSEGGIQASWVVVSVLSRYFSCQHFSTALCPTDTVQNIYERSITPGSRKRGDLRPPTESPTSSSLLCRSPLMLVESAYLLCHHITKVWFCFLCSCGAFQSFVVLFPKSRWHRRQSSSLAPNPFRTRATTAADQRRRLTRLVTTCAAAAQNIRKSLGVRLFSLPHPERALNLRR